MTGLLVGVELVSLCLSAGSQLGLSPRILPSYAWPGGPRPEELPRLWLPLCPRLVPFSPVLSSRIDSH